MTMVHKSESRQFYLFEALGKDSHPFVRVDRALLQKPVPIARGLGIE